MASEINLQSKDWLTLIFDGRNKEYGAYVIRNESSRRHLIALFSVLLVFAFFFTLSLLTKSMRIDQYHDTRGQVDMGSFNFDKPKVPEKNILRLPEPPPPMEKLKTSIKFTLTKIVDDEQVKPEDEMIAQDELTKTKAVISVMTVENGSDDGIDPKELKDHQVIMQEEKPPEIIDIAEVQPSFPGGDSELTKYLKNSIKYPTICQENNVQGQVVVQFVVSSTGVITDLRVVKGADKYLDAEAIRVLKSMPRWIPGKQGGVPVNVRFFVPVTFKLQ